MGHSEGINLYPNIEPFPLFADCMGKENGGLVSIILT